MMEKVGSIKPHHNGAQGFRMSYKREEKITKSNWPRVLKTNQHVSVACLMLHKSTALWSWMFYLFISCTASLTLSSYMALWTPQARTVKSVNNCFAPLTLLSGLNVWKHFPPLTRDEYSPLRVSITPSCLIFK